jgi:hypothetical protein
MSARDRRPFVRRATLAIACAAILIVWCASYGRPRGVSYFARDGTFSNMTIGSGAVRFQNGTYPRVNPAFAGVEGSLGWHAVDSHPEFPERATQSFCGVTSGEYTTPLRHHPFDKSGVHWSEVRFVSVPFWMIAGAFAVMGAIFILPGPRGITTPRAA